MEKKIQINISGTIQIDGIRADYYKFINGICSLIAVNLDNFTDKNTQYLIAHALLDYISKNAKMHPKGRMSDLSSLHCQVKVQYFTVHAYMIMRFPMARNHNDTLVYFLSDSFEVNVSYNLTLDMKEFNDKNSFSLECQGYSPMIIRMNDILVNYVKILHNETKNKHLDSKQLSRFFAENVIINIDKYKLQMTPPILPKLYAALSSEDKKVELNNVE